MQRHITIKEVARKAGVGIATVSRVINNSRRVDPGTRKRVLAVIRSLGYRPNASGRRLVKKSAEMVCFVLSNREFMNPFHSGILYGVERYLSQAGQDVVFSNLHYSGSTPPARLALPRILTERGIADGFILAGTNYTNLVTAMDLLEVPYVVFGNNLVGEARHPRADAVYYDDRSTARGLVERLIALGHRDIWFVGDVRMPWFRRRAESYRVAMQVHGLPLREYILPYTGDYRDYAVAYGVQAMEQILAERQPITAVVAGNDGIAYGAWRALGRGGRRVPQDISLVGFDDVQEAALTDPPLTTVRVPTEELGRACAQLLLEKLKARGAPQAPIIVPTEIVERGSWAAVGQAFLPVPLVGEG